VNAFSQRIVAFILDRIVKQTWLDGYRTYLAGASAIAGAVVIVLDMLAGGEYSNEKMGMAFASFVLGQKIIGDAGKRDKLIAATKNGAATKPTL
jgi:hypothetical protein